MISLEAAQERILAGVQVVKGEEIPLFDSLGRFLSTPIHSTVDLPPADNSAMDGYAVRVADVASSSELNLVALRLTGEVSAGTSGDISVERGCCARIYTGAMLPRGADAVVMQEDVKIVADEPGKIIFSEPAKPWENVRIRGEDIRTGDLLSAAGDELTAPRLSLLAAAGIATVTAGPQPLIGLLATGGELCEAGKPLGPGMIYESNRVGLSGLVRQSGGVAKLYPPVADDLGLTAKALKKAFAECDVVLTCGGVSVGEKDWVKQAFEEMGGQLDFWKVEMRPGKPFVFGQYGGKSFFGLPGNPVSAFVTFFLMVRPALLRMQGAKNVAPPMSWGVLAEPLVNRGDRRHFLRVIIDDKGEVKSVGPQGSHVLSSMARANGLVDVPPKTIWPAGTRVVVLRWD